MKSYRTWWLIYSLCVLISTAVLIWITVLLLSLESAERQARLENQHQEDIRLALWRMDSWLAPRLAGEAARPYFEYLPYHTQQPWSMRPEDVTADDSLTPSPLLNFTDDILFLHFQVDAEGVVRSPQAPPANLHEWAHHNRMSEEQLANNIARLDLIRQILANNDLLSRLQIAELTFAELTEPVSEGFDLNDPMPTSDTQSEPRQSKAKGSRVLRGKGYQQSQVELAQQQMSNVYLEGAWGSIQSIGPLIPVWLGNLEQDDPEPLAVVRRVETGSTYYIQGIWLHWQNLSAALLTEIHDLLPGARLVAVTEAAPSPELASRMLATIPIALEVDFPFTPAQAWSPVKTTLTLTWLALIIAGIAVGVTLRASIQFGERRSRFASAVTHELRTPLTTFRMYTEMLADGMVPEEETKRTYLTTLKDESARLSTLVENVLTYARLEEGRASLRRQPIGVEDLIDQHLPQLARRAEEAGMEIQISGNDDSTRAVVETDIDAVGQILLNLVDNACKYAASAENSTIEIITTQSIQHQKTYIQVDVCDHGPGIDPEFSSVLFKAFHRVPQPTGDSIPGVGLGLALSRSLARDMGGDLTYIPSAQGACFRLTLPVSKSS